ncbi:hypothetical protein B0H19DRAFT_1134427 [Mycena capillaripes]|nr:hypothetical protein B0H19DRAFT_1134427 [Mycena capillaripes]
MLSSPIILLSSALLTLTSATPMSARTTTCSPPAASNVSFGSILSDKGSTAPAAFMELALLPEELAGPFASIFWVFPGAPLARWNFVKSGGGPEFLIELPEVPGKPLTSVQGSGSIELSDGPANAQKWNITCTTCPPNGLATDCTFENNRFPNQTDINFQVCIWSDRLLELGNSAVIGDCQGPMGTSFQINYNL